MPRSYRHISSYENEIIETFNNGQNLRSMAEEYGFSYNNYRIQIKTKLTPLEKRN